MKVFFHYFNFLFVLICAFNAIIYGEQAVSLYFLLGVFQLLSGLIIFFNKIYHLKHFKEIIIYWILVLIYFLIVLNLIPNQIVKILIIPILIATYHCYCTYKLLKRPFLTAEWNDLALINYEIDPKILENYIPKGTAIDLWNDKCYISLIGFMFENVKVLGIKIPFHVNFEEVNLRFYVKRLEHNKWKRGVVFIKEIVPKKAISVVANTLYKEHYETLKMRHSKTENENSKVFRYEWQKDKKWNAITMETAKGPFPIAPGSEAEFITEHYFGYTQYSKNKTIEYEVTHPRWEQLEVINYTIDVDFESIYGSDFAFMQHLKPVSVFLALGSKITIEGKKIIK
jgi:uncharacterized protein YqjF (DUF2071 family)